jgi:hypothetical protein
MKRYDHLFENIVAFDNLLLAILNACVASRAALAWPILLEYGLLALQDELRTGTPCMRPYRTFTMPGVCTRTLARCGRPSRRALQEGWGGAVL